MVAVTETGIDATLAALKALPGAIRAQAAADRTAISRPVITAAATYPPELPNQRYERTFALRDGWLNSEGQITESSGGVEIQHINPVDHAEGVQVTGKQEFFFADRWTDLDTIAANAEPLTVEPVTASVVKALERSFG